MLLIWALDRLSREGIGALARYMEQLRADGVRVLSHQEPWVDTGSTSFSTFSTPRFTLSVTSHGFLAESGRNPGGQFIRPTVYSLRLL